MMVCILHDNACPHTTRLRVELLEGYGWDVFTPHSPDLATSDYHIFTELKDALGGERRENYDEIKLVIGERTRSESSSAREIQAPCLGTISVLK